LAIDVISEQAYLGQTPEEAYENARRSGAAKGIFHLMKIGSSGAYRVSYSPNGDFSRLFR
jgi:hypothetical protein